MAYDFLLSCCCHERTRKCKKCFRRKLEHEEQDDIYYYIRGIFLVISFVPITCGRWVMFEMSEMRFSTQILIEALAVVAALGA